MAKSKAPPKKKPPPEEILLPPGIVTLGGMVTWIAEGRNALRGEINGASLHNNVRLVLNISDNGIYSVDMQRGFGDEFAGLWSAREHGQPCEGRVAGRLFESMGNYFFFGEWDENNLTYYWWAELSPKEE